MFSRIIQMSKYLISGYWTNGSDADIYYAVHDVFENTVGKAMKKTKSQVINLLEQKGNSAKTWEWNYSIAKFQIGEPILVKNESKGKFLSTANESKITCDLLHLLNLGWFNSIKS